MLFAEVQLNPKKEEAITPGARVRSSVHSIVAFFFETCPHILRKSAQRGQRGNSKRERERGRRVHQRAYQSASVALHQSPTNPLVLSSLLQNTIQRAEACLSLLFFPFVWLSKRSFSKRTTLRTGREKETENIGRRRQRQNNNKNKTAHVIHQLQPQRHVTSFSTLLSCCFHFPFLPSFCI